MSGVFGQVYTTEPWLLVCRAAVAIREEVHEVLAGTVQLGSRPAADGQLLTVEQLAAMQRASAGAAASRGGVKIPRSKVGTCSLPCGSMCRLTCCEYHSAAKCTYAPWLVLLQQQQGLQGWLLAQTQADSVWCCVLPL
jgi:hypothetical protein